MSSYTNSKIYSLDEYLSSSLPAPTSPSSLIGLYPIRLPTSSRDPGLNDWFIPIQLLASSTDLAQVQVACSTLPLKLNLRFSLLCWFFDPTSLGFTPCSPSLEKKSLSPSFTLPSINNLSLPLACMPIFVGMSQSLPPQSPPSSPLLPPPPPPLPSPHLPPPSQSPPQINTTNRHPLYRGGRHLVVPCRRISCRRHVRRRRCINRHRRVSHHKLLLPLH